MRVMRRGLAALALVVACHKSMLFRTNDASGRVVDYVAAVSGGLRLVPDADSVGRSRMTVAAW